MQQAVDGFYKSVIDCNVKLDMIEKKIIKLEEGSEENNDSSASGSIVKLVSSLREAKNNFEDIKKDCEKDRKIEKEIVERLNAYTNRLQDKIENLQSIVYESFV